MDDIIADCIENPKSRKEYIMAIFFTEACMYCESVFETVKQSLKGFDINIIPVDVKINPDIKKKYSVVDVPTVLVYRDGELIDQIIGLQDPKRYCLRII